MKHKIIAAALCIALLLVMCACGAKEEPTSEPSQEITRDAVSNAEEPVSGETFHYENMYFSLDLPLEWENEVEIREERSGEYYKVCLVEKEEDLLLAAITLSAREPEGQVEYFGELNTDDGPGHLVISIQYPDSGELGKRSADYQAYAARIPMVLDTMQACGEFSIRRAGQE